MFAIVEFLLEESYAVVPLSWLKDDLCWWPNERGPGTTKLVQRQILPNDNGVYYKAKLIKTYSAYEEARRKLPEAERESALESEAENKETRRIRKKKKFSDSDEEENDEESPSLISRFHVPDLFAPQKQSVKKEAASAKNGKNTHKKTCKRQIGFSQVGSSQSCLTSSIENPVAGDIPVPGTSSLSSGFFSLPQVDSVAYDRHAPNTVAENIDTGFSFLSHDAEPVQASQFHSSQPVSASQFQSQYSPSFTSKEQGPAFVSRLLETHNAFIGQIADHLKQIKDEMVRRHTEYRRFEEEVVRSITQIKEKVKDLESKKNDAIIVDKKIPNLPLTSLEKLNDFETWLAEDENLALMIQYLGSIGGKTVVDTTRRIMGRVFSAELSVTLNWTGRHEKFGIQGLKITQVILASCRHATSDPLLSEKGVEDAMKCWLKHAKDRNGARKHH